MRIAIRRLTPLAVVACTVLSPSTASATSTAKEIRTAKTNGVAYLKTTQQLDGSFAGFSSDWALGALAAAGTAAADAKQSGGADARSFYRGLFGDPSKWPGEEPPITEYERAALDIYAAGVDPARVSAAQNLIAQIVSGYEPAAPGYYGGATNFSGALFGLLSLADVKTRGGLQRVPQALLDKSIAVVRGNQHKDGGWTFEKAEGNKAKLAESSEPDETGAAMAALCSAGVPSSDASIVNAEGYLKANLVNATGAFNSFFGANTDSNAWAVQGLNACGIEAQGPGFTTAMGKTPIDFLLSQQVAGGGFAYSPGQTESNEYSSQDALRSISGAGFTAKPPAPESGARWVFAGSFESGVPSALTLIVNDGTARLKACSVSLSPAAATTTLAAVLAAARTAATPSACVTSFAPLSGSGAITQINGAPSTPEPRWEVSIDGGKEKAAKRATAIKLGDTISLQLK